MHGKWGEDPTEPHEVAGYPYDPISHEPCVQKIVDRLSEKKIKMFHLPVGIRLNEKNYEASECVRCDTCDGFPCLVDAKSDSHTTCVRPALKMDNVTLITCAKAEKLIEEKGEITAVEVLVDGKSERFSANTFVLSCGAINSAALMLKSNVANSSDLVGRGYMCHNNSAIVAISKEKNTTKFQKTLGINDYYFGADDSKFPLGHIQLLGRVKKEMLKGDAPKITPGIALEEMADHAMGWWITSEDLPDPNNRVTIASSGQIQLSYTPNNLEAHERLYDKLGQIIHSSSPTTHIFPNSLYSGGLNLRKEGRKIHSACKADDDVDSIESPEEDNAADGDEFCVKNFPNSNRMSIYLRKKIPLAGVAHQVGTARFGNDPKSSVLDTNCKASNSR